MPTVTITEYLRKRVQLDGAGELISTSVSLDFIETGNLKDFLSGTAVTVSETYLELLKHRLFFNVEDEGGD